MIRPSLIFYFPFFVLNANFIIALLKILAGIMTMKKIMIRLKKTKKRESFTFYGGEFIFYGGGSHDFVSFFLFFFAVYNVFLILSNKSLGEK